MRESNSSLYVLILLSFTYLQESYNRKSLYFQGRTCHASRGVAVAFKGFFLKSTPVSASSCLFLIIYDFLPASCQYIVISPSVLTFYKPNCVIIERLRAEHRGLLARDKTSLFFARWKEAACPQIVSCQRQLGLDAILRSNWVIVSQDSYTPWSEYLVHNRP